MNLDDEDLFRDAMGDVTPLKDCANTQWLRAPSTKAPRQQPHDDAPENFLTRGFLEIIPRDTPLEYKADGIQQGVLDKLRLGKYTLDASLNLLRQPVETCRQSLFSFMLEARKQGLRNLLIIHGKGGMMKRTPILSAATWHAGCGNLTTFRPSAARNRSTVAAVQFMSGCAKPIARASTIANATPNAAVNCEICG